MENNNVVLSENVQQALSQLGAGTIMGDLQSISNDKTNEQLTQLKEEIEDKRESEGAKASDAVAIGGSGVNIGNYIPRKTRPLERRHAKIGRNDPCPCGSGKKYKNCCLATGQYEGYQEV